MTLRSAVIGIWIIATAIIIFLLYASRQILAPFALAVFLFLVIEGFARSIGDWWPRIGLRWAQVFSFLTVLGGFVLFIGLLARGVAEFSSQSESYEQKINALIGDIYGLFGMAKSPTLTELIFNEGGQRFLATIANATGELSGDLVIILIYLGFLFLAQSAWPTKLDAIFTEPDRRETVRQVGDAARRSIETYLWTQTVISAITTTLTYITLTILGVDNALFLSGLIFVLNYIPTIGSIIAALVPPLFALVQPDVPAWMPGTAGSESYFFALLVFAGVSLWQFAIGNFLQPRMMGESLNLSSLVVLLALAIWGAIWGIPGMFLSAPLTVLMMILFAQSPATYWIAVLLSADGRPLEISDRAAAAAEARTEAGSRPPV